MDKKQLMKFLSRSASTGLKSESYIGNREPTTYPGFGRFVDAVGGIWLGRGMSTKGSFLDRLIDQVLRSSTYVRLSLVSNSARTYEITHDVSRHFDCIIDNISRLRGRRDRGFPAIGLQYVVYQENLDDLYLGARAARDAGADYFSLVPVYNRGSVGLKIAKNNFTGADSFSVIYEVHRDLVNAEFSATVRPHLLANKMLNDNGFSYKKCVMGICNVQICEDGSVASWGPGQVQRVAIHAASKSVVANILNASKTSDLTKSLAGYRYHPLCQQVASILDKKTSWQFHPNFICQAGH